MASTSAVGWLAGWLAGSLTDLLGAALQDAMPQLWFPHTHGPQAHRGRQTQLALIASLAALVVVAVLALAATLAGRGAARRRRQLQWVAADRREQDLPSLLHAHRQQRHSSAAALFHAEHAGAGEAGEAGDVPALSRRGQARLAALLQAELDGQQQRGIELMPLDALPAAHHLGSLRKAVAAGSSLQGGRRGPCPPLPADKAVTGALEAANRSPEDAEPLLSSQHCTTGLDLQAPGSRLAVSASISGSGGRGGGSGRSSSASGTPPTSRQWGLPTDSLKLSSSDLTVGICFACACAALCVAHV